MFDQKKTRNAKDIYKTNLYSLFNFKLLQLVKKLINEVA